MIHSNIPLDINILFGDQLPILNLVAIKSNPNFSFDYDLTVIDPQALELLILWTLTLSCNTVFLLSLIMVVYFLYCECLLFVFFNMYKFGGLVQVVGRCKL